jgi:hypothetical protein
MISLIVEPLHSGKLNQRASAIGVPTCAMSADSASPARPPWWRTDDPGHRLAGNRAFVTGAGTAPDGDLMGVGEAIAILFAAQGARVAVADKESDRAEATLTMIEQVGGEGIATIGDLTNVEDNRRCVEEAADVFGGLDVVVNSAALDGGGRSPPTSNSSRGTR